MFSVRMLPSVPKVAPVYEPQFLIRPGDISADTLSDAATNRSGRLMQHLGINLWQWLFDGPIQSSLDQSQGIAMGQVTALRLRLEVRSPDLIGIPWEIMQPQAGKPAISLNQQVLFSRTTSDVDPLPILPPSKSLRILLVLGENPESGSTVALKLEQEADALTYLLEYSNHSQGELALASDKFAHSHVDSLVQPTPAELIKQLENGAYNILFYSGHGMPGPDGGLLFLHPKHTLNGTELAQVLIRCRVTLAVFNACWGAQPDQGKERAIPRSSLAEVLIHHGVPAVLAMRDAISDREALTFIQAFAQALAQRMAIDQAVAVARQQLLTLYKFNHPAWSLPVLYMHPEFDGELLLPVEEGLTELPLDTTTQIGHPSPPAYLRSVGTPSRIWSVQDGFMRIGRREENDLVILEPWVSQRHAEIFCRENLTSDLTPTYFLRDFSRFGTLVSDAADGWRRVHHQEMVLESGVQLKFGSSQGQPLEFITEESAH
jgi:hypothetical protein